MNDYVILFDENGQPYVAHGQIITNLKKGAKSVAKLVDGAKTRYFSSQKELKAYYDSAKKKAGAAAEKASAGAKKAYNSAKSGATKAYNSAKSAYDKGKRAVVNAADKLGVDDRIRFNNAKNGLGDLAKAAKEYSQTPLGKAEIAAKKAASSIKKHGGDALGKVKESASKFWEGTEDTRESIKSGVSSAASKAGNAVKGAASSAGNAIKGAASTVAEKAGDVKESAEIKIADTKRKKAWEKYNKAKESGADKKTVKKLYKEFQEAQTDWMLKSGL